ncbi:transmembrane protein C17orf113-like [Haliotis rubra]|uniref:transmembrane protein C17orf113-like n=1 Tax=Haliotis rubra TaxID=36100 RepID=UPI001EE5933B|nr:transmembrane protein C17orf113-like [Haliotis rubra]
MSLSAADYLCSLWEWEKVTSNPWVLSTLRDGHMPQWKRGPPPFSGIRCTPGPNSQEKADILCAEVQSSLDKAAIEVVPTGQENQGVYSTYFLVTKKDGGVLSWAKKKNRDANPSVTAAMRTVFYMAKEDIPIQKYSSLMEFQKIEGNEDIAKLSVGSNATYMSQTAGEEFQESIAETIHKDVIKQIRAADMYSILVDESTDIAVNKQMILYARMVDPVSFTPLTFFVKNITIRDPRSDAEVLFKAIQSALNEEGLSMSKVYGFGSDGAAVMVGRKSGVAKSVKDNSPHCVNIHCMAHRFNLATSQASKNIDELKSFEKTLVDLYYYFGGSKSGNRKCEWIAFLDAVQAVYKSWPALIEYFKKHSDQKSKSFLETLSSYRFIALLHVLMDVLPSVAQMSLVFQKQDIDIAVVQPALNGLKNKLTLIKSGQSHYQAEFKEQIKCVIDKDTGHTKSVSFKKHNLSFEGRLSETTKAVSKVRNDLSDNMSRNMRE